MAVLVTPAAASVSSAASPSGACVDGFDTVAVTRQILPEGVYAVSADKAILAGGAKLGGGRKAARIMRFESGAWKHLSTRYLGVDAGYAALGGTGSTGLWAVGTWQTNTRMSPLVVRQRSNANWSRTLVPSPGHSSVLTEDLIFFTRGSGRSFRVVAAPSRAGGVADDVHAIDHDQNGLTDFLVLNGRGTARGPVQLISFYR